MDKMILECTLRNGAGKGFVTFLPEYPAESWDAVKYTNGAYRICTQERSYDFWLGRVSDVDIAEEVRTNDRALSFHEISNILNASVQGQVRSPVKCAR